MYTMGGFQALLRIVESSVASGMVEDRPWKSTQMKLEGKVAEFNWKARPEGMPREIRAIVSVDFEESQRPIDISWAPEGTSSKVLKKHMGRIKMGVGTPRTDYTGRTPMLDFLVRIDMLLPFALFPEIARMKEIILETVHTLVEKENEDDYVALIQRAYFKEVARMSDT